MVYNGDLIAKKCIISLLIIANKNNKHLRQQYHLIRQINKQYRMIQRTHLPNLAIKAKQSILKSYSYAKQSKKQYNTQPSQNDYYKNKFKLIQQNNYQNKFYSISHVQINKKYDHLKTQTSVQSQMNTLQLKMNHYNSVFQTKTKSHQYDLTDKKNIVPYFFKVHHSHNFLENSQMLRQKMMQSQLIQAAKNKPISIENSKNKLSKKLVNSSSKNISISTQNNIHTGRLSTKTNNNLAKNISRFYTQSSQNQNQHQIFKARKEQLTQKAKQAKYSFKYFNSGQIFQQIAEINQEKILSNPDKKQYRVTAYGTYVNNISGTKSLDKNKLKNKMQEEFKQEYNSFLKNKLPPSFGQNGNKSCIYEQYVEKRHMQDLNKIKSKLIEGNYLRTQPSPPQRPQFIFSNQIKVVSAKKIQMEEMYEQEIRRKQDAMINKKNSHFVKNSSAQTSKMVTQMNTKMNTLRQGRSMQQKLKLKKLAKLQMKQKAKILLKSKIAKNSKKSNRQNSSLQNYNNISDQDLDKFLAKSHQILDKQYIPINPEDIEIAKNSKNKNKQQSTQLNEYESKHLQNIDKLLKKQASYMKKEKQDLDSLPWRIPIKVQNKQTIL